MIKMILIFKAALTFAMVLVLAFIRVFLLEFKLPTFFEFKF